MGTVESIVGLRLKRVSKLIALFLALALLPIGALADASSAYAVNFDGQDYEVGKLENSEAMTGETKESEQSVLGLEVTAEASSLSEQQPILDEPIPDQNEMVSTASASDVCAIGAVSFATLSEALAVAQDGQTIRLLTNIVHNESIVINGKSLTFDVGSYELYVSTVWQSAIQVSDGNLWLDDSGGGELNAHCSGPYSHAVLVSGASSTVTVTDANAHFEAVAVSAGSVTVKGDATATSLDDDSSGVAIDARHGGRVLVMGTVTATSTGVYANGLGTSVHVMGDAYGFGKPTQHIGTGAYAGSGATVVIGGDAIGEVHGAYTMNGTITVGGNAEGGNPYLGTLGTGVLAERDGVALVYGNVKGTLQGAWAKSSRISIVGNVTANNQNSGSSEIAVYAQDGGNITVAGNVQSAYIGVYTDNWGSFVQVRGSVTADFCAAFARQSSTIQIDGSILYCRYKGIDIGAGCLITVAGNVIVELSTEAVPVTYGVYSQFGTVEIGGNLSGSIGVFAEYGNARVYVAGNVTADHIGVHADNMAQVTIDGVIDISPTAVYITSGTMNRMKSEYEPVSSKPGYLEYDLGDSYVWVKGASVGLPRSGDLNGDGIVTLDEALIIVRVVAGVGMSLTVEQFAAVDMDADGSITMTDVLLMVRRACGL